MLGLQAGDTIPSSTLKAERQVDGCEFQVILVYIVSFRPVKTTVLDPMSIVVVGGGGGGGGHIWQQVILDE